MTITRFIRIISLFIGLVTLVVIFWFVLPWEKLGQAEKLLGDKPVTVATPKTFTLDSLEAKAGIVMEEKTGQILFNKNGDQPLPLASITKLMTAMVAEERLARADELFITITPKHLENGSNAGLVAGSIWEFSDLLDYMLTTSSNGAANAIADTTTKEIGEDFVFLMNNKAKELKLETMHFTNPTGLDGVAGRAGGTASAIDVAKLMSYITDYSPHLIESTKFSSIRKETTDHNIYFGQNTNLIIRTIPGFMGSKTGYTDQAGGNLVIAFDAGLDRPIVAVVLGSTQDGRFSDMKKLVSKTIETLAK